MSRDLMQEGLEAYACGDFAGAAHAWVRARIATPSDKALAQYLQHLRLQAADLVEQAEGEEAAARRPAELSASADDAALPEKPEAPLKRHDVAVAVTTNATSTNAAFPPIPDALASAELPADLGETTAGDPWGEPALLGGTAKVDSMAPGLILVAEATRAQDATPHDSVAAITARMRDAAELDDFSSALKAADELLAIEPLNSDARRTRERARSVLTQMLISELGTLDAIPTMAVPDDQVIWLDLDQRAGFVLAQVDGRSSFNDIVAVTGMDELETLGILAKLVRDKIVAPR